MNIIERISIPEKVQSKPKAVKIIDTIMDHFCHLKIHNVIKTKRTRKRMAGIRKTNHINHANHQRGIDGSSTIVESIVDHHKSTRTKNNTTNPSKKVPIAFKTQSKVPCQGRFKFSFTGVLFEVSIVLKVDLLKVSKFK